MYLQTFTEHLQHLESVFQRLRQAGVKLKPTKCLLFRQEVRYLGHLVTSTRYTLDPEDKAAVLKLKDRRPSTVGKVRQLLGLLGIIASTSPILLVGPNFFMIC